MTLKPHLQQQQQRHAQKRQAFFTLLLIAQSQSSWMMGVFSVALVFLQNSTKMIIPSGKKALNKLNVNFFDFSEVCIFL